MAINIDKQQYDTLIFDFDGTLVDTEPNHYEAFVKALEEIGINYVSYEDHLKIYTGTGSKFIFAKELEKNNKDADLLEALIKRKGEFYKSSLEENTPKQIDGAAAFLSKAKNMGFKIGLVSGGGLKDIKHVMEKAGIPDVFEVYVTQDDKYKPKPDPEGFILAVDKLKSTSDKSIVFEDALNGVKAALAADIKPIALTTYRSGDDFTQLDKSIKYISSFTDIYLKD
jgi:HAD superfamily hydrolase (TIGR01509 family)